MIYIITILLAALVVFTIYDLLVKLEEGSDLNDDDYDSIEAVCSYLDSRYDCSDFRMQTLIRMLCSAMTV